MTSLLTSFLHKGNARSVLIRKNILAGFAIKGWSALTVLLSVPLTLKCLGVYQNGVWLTISSMLVWMDMLDIGLGNGLRNKLTIHLAEGDMAKARQTVSSTFAMLAIIVSVALACIGLLIYGTDVYGFLNVEHAQVHGLRYTLLVATIIVSITFVMKLIGNVFMSHQLPAVSNLLTALGQTVALISTYMLYVTHTATLFTVIVANTASPLLVYLAAYPYTFCARYPELRPAWRDIDLTVARQMMNLGIQFFAIQVASLVLFLSSNLIISRLYSPEMVNPYQITYRYFSLVLILFTVICVPFWNATTDAYTRQDMSWIRKASHNLRLVTAGMVGLLFVMILLSEWVYALWIGTTISIPLSLSIAMGAYIAILVSSMRYSYFLNGIGALRLQLITTMTAAILFIPLAWITATHTTQLTWFVVVLCAVNTPGLIINHIQFNRIVTGKAKGIWRR